MVKNYIKGFMFNLFFIESIVYSKLAPCLSILLINAILGILNLLAYNHTVSDYVYTPETPSNIAIAPSVIKLQNSNT